MLILAAGPPIAPHAVLIALGFVVGALGSAHRNKPVTALGIALVVIGVATFQWRLYESAS